MQRYICYIYLKWKILNYTYTYIHNYCQHFLWLMLLHPLSSLSLFSRDSGVVDHLSVHHRAHPQRQQQAVPLSPTSLSARGDYGEDGMSDRFTEGQDVLARWSDGLFYLGTITKVIVRERLLLVLVLYDIATTHSSIPVEKVHHFLVIKFFWLFSFCHLILMLQKLCSGVLVIRTQNIYLTKYFILDVSLDLTKTFELITNWTGVLFCLLLPTETSCFCMLFLSMVLGRPKSVFASSFR